MKNLTLGALLIMSILSCNSANSKKEIFTYVEQMPEFNGDYNKFIQSNLHYPENARENNIEGRVTLRFVVNEDGAVSDVSIIKSPDSSLSRAALEVVTKMPRWIPGKQNNKKVSVYFTLPIVFKLN